MLDRIFDLAKINQAINGFSEEMKEIYRKRNEEYHIKTFQRNSNKNKQM